MPVIWTFGDDILQSNVESRQAHHDLNANVKKLGIRKGTITGEVNKLRTKNRPSINKNK